MAGSTKQSYAAWLGCCLWILGCKDAASRQPQATQVDAGPPDADAASGDAATELVPRVGPDFVEFANVPRPDSGVLDLSFEVHEDAHAFVLSATMPVPGYVELMGLISPAGDVLFDARTPDAGPFQPALYYNLEDSFPFSLLYPSGRGEKLAPGRYAARLGFLPNEMADAALAVHVDVVFQRKAAPKSLAAAFWLAPGAAYDARTLIADPVYLEAFGHLRAIFRAAGLTLDPLQAFDLVAPSEPDSPDLASIDEADMRTLVALLEAQPTGGLDIVWVDSIRSEGKTLRGKTLGMPGPPSHPELKRRSAVVLAFDALPREPHRIAEAIAHEMAHYLGLRHTTEMDGSRADTLDDTPECPIENATFPSASGELLLRAEDCAAYDGENLLFPMPPTGLATQEVLSEGQIEHIKRHPLVH